MYITKLDQIKILGIEDLDFDVQDLILSQSKFKDERYNSRKEFLEKVIQENTNHPYQKILLPLLELIGRGGHNGLGTNYNGRSKRLPVFSCLGKGRKNASDGPVWDYHLREKLNELSVKLKEYEDNEFCLIIYKDDVERVFFYPGESGYIDCHDEFLVAHKAQKCAAALFGQLLIALTRDQQYIALSLGDDYIDSECRPIAYRGLEIDESLRSPEGVRLVGELYSYYKCL